MTLIYIIKTNFKIYFDNLCITYIIESMKTSILLITSMLSLVSSSVTSSFLQTPKVINVRPTLAYDENLGIFKDQTTNEIQTYYGALSNKTGIKGEELKLSLESIIKQNQIYRPYSQWEYYYLLDRNWVSSPLTDNEISSQKRNQTGIKLRALYDEEDLEVTSRNTTPRGAIGNIINREHVWVKSRGLMRKSETGSPTKMPSCDLQNLHAGEAKNNQDGHNNYPYGNVLNKNASSTTKTTSLISGNITGRRGLDKNGIEVYEPLPSDKGNIARTLFYMETRYHTYDAANTTPALLLDDSYEKDVTINVESTETTPANYGLLSTLLERNVSDPVDDAEKHRNNLCYNVATKNRNPFIDYPKWVDCIYKSNESLGVDIEAKDGVQTGLSIEGVNNPLYVHPNDPINLDSMVVKYLDNTIQPSEYTLKISDGSTTKDFSSGDTISEVGDYTLTASYIKNNATLTGDISIKVRKKVDEIFGSSDPTVSFQDVSLISGNTVDLNLDDLTITDEYGVSHKLTKDDYTIELTTPSGKKEIYASDYVFTEEGTYIATYIYNFNGKTFNASKKIIVTLSFFETNKVWIILAAVGIIVLIFTIVIYKNIHRKKRRKRK